MTETLPAGDLAARLAERLARAKAYRPSGAPAIPPRPAGVPVPLSAAQRRQWFLHQWDPMSAAYNIPIAWRMRGALDVARLRIALDRVVAGSEVLRTRYPSQDGEPTAVIDPPQSLPLAVAEVTPDEIEPRLVALARQPFTLDTRWPVRADLLRVAPDDHVLLVSLHHIAADGWSVGLLAERLGSAYTGATPAEPVQYADVTHARAQADNESELVYWTRRLAGVPTPLTLPTDRPRPAAAGDAGAMYRFELDEDVTAGLRRLATAEHATSFMVLLAGFSALCARYSGTDDVVVGSPVAGRDAATAGVLGCFVNTLVLRTRVGPDLTARQLLATVRAEVLADTEHASLPYERLIEALPGQAGTGGLFTVQLVATNVPRTPLALTGLDVVEVFLDPGAAKLDVSLAIEDLGGPTMAATLTYRTELFDARTMSRFAAHYHRLLAAMSADPDAPIASIDPLEHSERAVVLAAPARAADPKRTIVDEFEGWVARHPARRAVVAADGALSYAELERAATRLAHRLRAALGQAPGDAVVGLDATRNTGFVVGLLGILKAGAAYLPIDPDQPLARRAAMLAAAGASLHVGAGAPPGVTTIDPVNPGEPDHAVELSTVEVDDLAYVIFTSGSTGTPKGVAVEHRQLMSYLDAVGERLAAPGDPLPAGLSYAACSTMAADLAHTMVFGAIASGGTLHLLDATAATDPVEFAAALRRDPVDYLKLVPSHLAALLAAADTAEEAAAMLPTRCLVLGGESASWELIDRVRQLRPGLRVLNHYGPTETTVGAIAHEVPLSPTPRPATIPLGRPLAHMAVRIVDALGRPTPTNVPGELYLGGAGVARGYLGRQGETELRFGADPTGAAGPELRFYRTGDLARWLADGTVEFLGRADRQLKIRGFRVEPAEIEAVLREHPGITDAVVVGVGGRLIAYIVTAVGESASSAADTLANWAADRLPAHLVPAAFAYLPALPLTANGKLDRAALPAVDFAGTEGTAPASALERLVAEVFAEVLGCDEPSRQDNFFGLGGHSLLATQVVSRLRRSTGIRLSLPGLFAHPTVAALAQHLAGLATDDSGAGATPPAEVIPIGAASAHDRISYAQRRLWFLDQAHPGNPAYNLPYVLSLESAPGVALDVAALRRALNAVVARHDALRTTVRTVKGEPLAVVADSVELALPVTDLRGLAEAAARREIDAEFRDGFDLATGPLVRARLLRTAEHTHLLLLTLHHIAFDGWSLAILVDELAAGYRGEPVLPPRLSYGDYASWQLDLDHDAALGYWSEALAGAPARLDLPADRPRPPRPSYAGGAVPVDLPAATLDRVAELARGEGATTFMALLATYQILLARYAGVDDLVVGTPVAGRAHPDLEPMIGFFVNMLPLRGRPAAGLSFREYLNQVRDTVLGAFGHADLPFERLVEHLKPERDPSRAPIFSTMLSLRNTRPPRGDLPGLTLRELDGPTGVAKYDLSLVLTDDHTGGLHGALEFSSDLFDPETAARLADSFHVLLAAALADPHRTIGDLPLMSDEQRRRMLVEWNATAAEQPNTNVPALVAAAASARPRAVALVDDGLSYTYAELDALANRLAHRLIALGAGPSTLVAVSARRSIRVVAALLGIMRAGAAYVPLDTAQPVQRLAYMLADSGAPIFITDGTADGITFDGTVLDLADDHLGEHATDPGVAIDPSALAYVIYTSGSTGQPKGVCVEHRGLTNFVLHTAQTPGLTPGAVWLAVATFSFDMSGLDLWLPLTVGARVVLASRADAMDGAALARRLRAVDATHMQATPVTWRLLLGAGWPGDPDLTALCGGEALPPVLVDTLLPRVRTLWNLYGPTETTIYSTVKQVTGRPVTVGRPIANTTVHVLDDRLAPVPVGVTGEVYLGGAGLARGYHNRAELTRERFITSPYGRLYRTGDLGRWRADGELEVLGRADGQVKVRGYRIETGEIEAVLTANPEVTASVVDVRTDIAGEAQLVAYVVGTATGAGLRGWLGERLPTYMIPGAFISLPALPTTPNGKVDRRALPEPIADAAAPEPAPDATLTPTEATVDAAFAWVLGHHDFGPDDDFFAVGGESMRAVRVVRELDPTLSVLDLFTHPSVRALATHLDQGRTSEARLLHRLTPPRDRPAEVSLVCAPFGGGGAIAYADLAGQVPDEWDVYALQPPGRDPARPGESLLGLAELADAAADRVLAEVPGAVVVYGHCVGAALAIQLARRLEDAGRDVLGVAVAAAFPTSRLPGPLDLVARLAPGRRQSDRAIADSLRMLGGLGEELPEEHRAQLARAVRHDAREGELSYTTELRGSGPRKLAAPLVIAVGENDPVTEFYAERAHEWSGFASTVDVAVVPKGGHFFQRAETVPALVGILRAQVGRWRSGAPPASPPVVPPPARLAAFGLVTLGQLVSLIGSGLTAFALGVWAYQSTGAVTAFAAIATFGILPAVLVAPVAGAVADRYDRRQVMLWCDAVGLAASAALAGLVWTDTLAMWHLYALVILTAAATTFRQPAYLAAVAQLTPKRYLGQANGVVNLGTASGAMVAQLAGGLLTVTVGLTGVAWIDIASYTVALATLLMVRFPDLAFVKRDGPLLREIAEGWRFLAKRRSLVALTVFFAIANALGGVVIVLVTPLVLAFDSPSVLGTVLAANGAGMLAGGALMAVWGGTRRRAAGMIGFVGLFAVSAIVIGLRPTAFFPALGMFGIGVCAALINAHWLALVQVKVGPDLLGRILATCLMFARTVMPLGYLVTGPLVDHVFEPAMTGSGLLRDLLGPVIGAGPGRGMAVVMILTGLVALLWTVAGYRYRPMREADGDLPDALPDLAGGGEPTVRTTSPEPDHARTPARS